MTKNKKRVTASEAGRTGYEAFIRKTTKKQRSEWARKGALAANKAKKAKARKAKKV